MYPAVAAERLIHRFQYWTDGRLQTGMRQGYDLYRQVATFPTIQRQQAYHLGTDLAQQGQAVVLTHAEDGYIVWVALRSTLPAQAERTALPPGKEQCA